MAITISQATIKDTEKIMSFINDVWRKGHILSYHKELFLYDFQEENKLNFIIAKDDERIIGLFGFIKYNSLVVPDIAGSLWKVDPSIKTPLLGIKLREYFVKNIPHRFFAAPGAGLQTKPIYKAIKMDWNRMDLFYLVNPNIKEFAIIKNPEIKVIEEIKNYKNIYKANNIKDLVGFTFDENVVPLKDFAYIQKRFFQHPIFKYDTWYLKEDESIKNIFISRLIEINNTKVYRIVDFFGSLDNIFEIVQFLNNFIREKSIEYCDFISHGLDKKILLQSGFSFLDFDNGDTIVPNFFEPFLQQNVPIYCVSDKTDKVFRQFKADGDQDRPNQSTNGVV